MASTLSQLANGRLERLCNRSPGRIRIGAGAEGIERLEAHFRGQAFAPHRHDVYAIGLTLAGVQAFRYRGEQRHCLAGQCHVLHPDEVHDGAAATGAGFGYRMCYVDPALVQDALGGRPLPFVASPVLDTALLPADFAAEVWDLDAALDDVARAVLTVAVADLLVTAAGETAPRLATLAVEAVTRVRALIASHPEAAVPMAALERESGLDRWTLARHFRALFGTSPGRFRTLRRLDTVRRMIGAGIGLAEASVTAGFADQSHMSRRFKAAYGMTPGAWAAAGGAGHERSARPRPRPRDHASQGSLLARIG